ncbi:MAG: hypothetical protein LBJ41_03360 [Treponema sp.]|nr:hypothetical protein [Treponema sp.]
MKKKIAMVLLILVLGRGTTYAFSYAPHLIMGPIGIAGGIVFLTTDPSDMGQIFGWTFIIAGGLDLFLGFLGMAIDEPAFAQNDPVLKHVSLSMTPDKLFIGASFDF